MNSGTIYLDNATTSFPKAEAVYDAVDMYQRRTGAAFARGTHGSETADSVADRCRHQLAQMIGAQDPRSVAFTFNATDGLNLLLRGVLRSGDRVLTTTLEHNSVVRPLEQLRDRLSITVDYVPFDSASGVVDSNQFEQSCRTHSPSLVILNMASNVTGIVQPLPQLIRAAKSVAAIVLVDGAQAVGHVPLNVQTLDLDLLAAPGHKALGGPLGTGFVYVRPSVTDRMISFRCGGTGTDSSSVQQPVLMPELLESGNLNMPGIAGLAAALSWRNTDEFRTLLERHHRQIPDLIRRLSEIPRVTVCCEPSVDQNVGVVSFFISGIDPHEVAVILSQSFGIQCRAGLHCAPLAHRTLGTESSGGTIRLSPGLFTTDEEIDQAVDAVSQIVSGY
ncbi:MAG: aminotransferase class V-fold PLP-dependent enzyme [Fuerstiella sp.]|nr:aminotransferase class V-fold PLP-dependent enzyme [Fuerstiella sp.]